MTEPSAKSASSLLLPPPTATMAPQKLGIPGSSSSTTGGGSATGNPRNKCALKPGHSLMDWIRLGNTPGVDLAGTRGRVVAVSSKELAKHNKREDAWMAIRGRVYNVTRYMDFHPGGVDELMRGIGRDATKLFDEVHAWVNYQQLLSKCCIGPLHNVVKMEAAAADLMHALSAKTKDDFKKPTPPPPVSEIVPRFDWIQRRADLTLSFYTRHCCNPGLILQRRSEQQFQLRVHIARTVHIFDFELHAGVEWPPQMMRVASESGKIELGWRKQSPELWSSYGGHTTTKSSAADGFQIEGAEEADHDFEVVECVNFNADSFVLRLRAANAEAGCIIWPPIGYHVSIEAAAVNGAAAVRRSYTPVPATFLPHSSGVATSASVAHLNFLVKSYADGLFSSNMRSLKTGDRLQLSAPKGGFNLSLLLGHRRLQLLAAGSGLTPMLGLIQHLLQRQTNRLEYLQLMYFNKTAEDIWCRAPLEQLQVADERFKFVNVLSQGDGSWSGPTGRVSLELLASYADDAGVTFAAICGPSAFNEQVEILLQQLKFSADSLHTFQG